ncbi:MFS multidrug transporter [Myriangium duriaei CBS 260.36]|uniref:MFS multidrug transporter n=1 Tax=Myriangium duriaei CBS 260.36 TaxID=1168546 RepID=A0A9P4MJI5_9PEZI|nr:MFS multidrug transporter [Myriangium duriaei CBS 260.36]
MALLPGVCHANGPPSDGLEAVMLCVTYVYSEKDAGRNDHSPAYNLDDSVEWRYLTWTTDLPLLAPPSTGARPDLPPTDCYEKYISPFLWSAGKKSFITWLSCAATVVTAYTAGSYTAGDAQMMAYWGLSKVVVTTGVTIFTCGFAIAPMVLAPFSEINGRRPVFVITGILFVVLQLCCAVTRSFAGMLISRFLAGCFSSTFSTMVGGVVSDIYHTEDRNTAMALFSGAALFGTGLGPMISGFIAAHLSWRWIFYLQVITCGVMMVAIAVFFKETRGSVLLSRKASAVNSYYDAVENLGIPGIQEPDTSGRQITRRIRWKVKSDEERASIGKMISVSLYRPFHLLLTEPTVFFFSLWVSFSWAVLYLTFGAVPLVFQTLYRFDLDQSGAVFAALSIAALISTVVAIYGDKIMRRRRPDMYKSPEGRLWFPCIQSILLPIGLFWFGCSAYRSVPWIVPALGVGCATMGIFSIYLAVFNYLADTYHRYASSALAAQSFCRNMLGGVLPLVIDQMFHKLGFQGGGSLLGGIGLLLTAVPFALLIYGPRIRARSKFASELKEG